jgi:hypothetical protein
VEARPGWHAFFSDTVRFVLAPLVLLFSGFFTANFIISGAYTWPRTSRTLALTLTVLILSREFVYKEQLSRNAAPAVRGRRCSILVRSLCDRLVGDVGPLRSSRMLKQFASSVLASFRSSTYPRGTLRSFTRCGLAGWPV